MGICENRGFTKKNEILLFVVIVIVTICVTVGIKYLKKK